ncbi:hypothetical protein Ciccas_010427 [Cichlidogyrus casuarinus]|uniref:Uncharacterized protein n=1 Tax=Cichlidogyrus casuarinus TaxID=1844966 RepID=A0ABD2PU46_9PLAT
MTPTDPASLQHRSSFSFNLADADQFLSLACGITNGTDVSSAQLFDNLGSEQLIKANENWNGLSSDLVDHGCKNGKSVRFKENSDGSIAHNVCPLIVYETARRILRKDRIWEFSARRRSMAKLLKNFANFDEYASSSDDEDCYSGQKSTDPPKLPSESLRKRRNRRRRRKNGTIQHKDSILIAACPIHFTESSAV